MYIIIAHDDVLLNTKHCTEFKEVQTGTKWNIEAHFTGGGKRILGCFSSKELCDETFDELINTLADEERLFYWC